MQKITRCFIRAQNRSIQRNCLSRARRKNEIIHDYLTELEPFIETVLPQEQMEENIIDCTDAETDVIMQNAFKSILAA